MSSDQTVNHESDFDAISKLRPSPLKNQPRIVVDNALNRDMITIKESKERIKELEDRVNRIEYILRKYIKQIKTLNNNQPVITKQVKPTSK